MAKYIPHTSNICQIKPNWWKKKKLKIYLIDEKGAGRSNSICNVYIMGASVTVWEHYGKLQTF